jgi:hypothetical protein
VWAPYWYDSVHASTGFAPYRPPAEPLPPRLEPLAERCRPYFERLHAYRIPADRAKGARRRLDCVSPPKPTPGARNEQRRKTVPKSAPGGEGGK